MRSFTIEIELRITEEHSKAGKHTVIKNFIRYLSTDEILPAMDSLKATIYYCYNVYSKNKGKSYYEHNDLNIVIKENNIIHSRIGLYEIDSYVKEAQHTEQKTVKAYRYNAPAIVYRLFVRCLNYAIN